MLLRSKAMLVPDKRRARLNCIAHFLKLIPHKRKRVIKFSYQSDPTSGIAQREGRIFRADAGRRRRRLARRQRFLNLPKLSSLRPET
jgi:hypothetical protein